MGESEVPGNGSGEAQATRKGVKLGPSDVSMLAAAPPTQGPLLGIPKSLHWTLDISPQHWNSNIQGGRQVIDLGLGLEPHLSFASLELMWGYGSGLD